jgi:hypothetical protein
METYVPADSLHIQGNDPEPPGVEHQLVSHVISLFSTAVTR